MTRTLLMLLLAATLSAGALAQTSPSSSPEPASTPKPVVKRRTFDQFDLSNGISVGGTRSSEGGFKVTGPATVEFVDVQTYEGMRKFVEYVDAMGAEYRLAVSRSHLEPNELESLSTLNRKINAALKIVAIFREGMLGQTPLQNPVNLLILEDSQTTLREAGHTVAIYGGWSKNEVMLAKMAAKYNADRSAANTRQAILIAMLAHLNTNLNQVMSQIAVKKQ